MEIIYCQGCDKEDQTKSKPSQSHWARTDIYGIYTGIYCDNCYNSDRYPYRKDDYFDSAYAEEKLEED